MLATGKLGVYLVWNVGLNGYFADRLLPNSAISGDLYSCPTDNTKEGLELELTWFAQI